MITSEKMNDRITIRNYLQLAGVNDPIITYLEKNTGLYFQIKDFLGEDFISGMNINPNGCVDKLKQGNAFFKILEKGNVWYLSTETSNAPKFSSNLYLGSLYFSGNEKYMSITNRSYIAIEDNYVVVRTVKEKQKQENIFDGEILEEIYTLSLNKVKRTTSYWFDSMLQGIPNKDLTLQIEDFNEFGFAEMSSLHGNYNTPSWNFVYNGKEIKKLEVVNERKSLKEKLKIMEKFLKSKKEFSEDINERNSKSK